MKQLYLISLIIFSFFNAIANNSVIVPSATISGTTAVCVNATSPLITFTGSGGVAPYTFTYKLNNGADLIRVTTSGNSVTLSVPATVAGIFTYSLVSVSDASTPITAIPASGTAVVTVAVPPVIDFTFANNNACSGIPVQFTSTVSGTGTKSYSWNFGDGTPTSNLQNPLHDFTALGCGTQNFTVTLTVLQNGCTVTKTNIITVNQKPNINFIDTVNSFDPFSNCANATTNPVYTISVGNNSSSTCVSSYSINWGDGIVQNNITFPISHTYNAIGAYSMAVSATGTNGCVNTKTYIIKNVSNPLGGLNSPGSTQNLCAPTANLQFSISNWGTNSPDTKYTVNYGDGTPMQTLTQIQMVASSFYNAANPSSSPSFPIPHIYNTSSCPSSSFQVTLIVTNACGTTPFTLGSVSILIKPTADFVAPARACINTSILIANTTTNGFSQNCAQSSVYKWDFGDGSPIITTPLSPPTNINHTYTTPGTYTISLTAQNFCGTSTKTQTICIEPPLTPSFTINTNEGCTPLAITTNNTTLPTNSCSPPTYIWNVTYTSGNCGTSISAIPNQTTTNATYNFTQPGTYTIRLTANNSCSPSQFTTQTVVVKKPPAITAINGILPNYCGPTTINASAVVAACTPSAGTLTYAWNFSGGNPSTSLTQVPGPVNYTASGNYTISLIVSNECGASTILIRTFTINDVPTLTTTPLTQSTCSGTTTSAINLTSNIVGTTYTWTATATSGISGFIPSGITNTIPSQTITTTNLSTGTVTYVITPSINGCIGSSANYVITINPGPSFTSQPISSTICLGGIPADLTVTLNSNTGNPSYQWYSNALNNTTSGTAISGATNSTYSPTASTIGVVYYYCIITLTSGGCSNLTSNIAAVTVVNSASITIQPLSTQNLCVGATTAMPLAVSYSGGTGTASYQWYSNATNTTIGGTLIAGATNATYTPTVFTSAGTNYYYVIITLSGNSCGNLTSSVAEVVVNNDPTIATQPLSSQTLCQNATPSNLNVVLSAGGGTFSYQWYSNSVNITTGGTLIIGATNSIYTPLTTVTGQKYYYCIITQNGANGCGVTSDVATVIINVAPLFTSQPLSNAVCLGQSPSQLNVSFANGSGIAQIQWYSNSSNSNIGGTAIPAANSNNYQPASNTIGTNFYYCVITFPSLSGGCGIITSDVAVITINPIATIASQTITICSGATFTITPNNLTGDIVPTGTTYTWSNPVVSPSGSVTGASVQTTSQNSISQTLISTISSAATVAYTVTPTTGLCIGNSFTIIVTVNPATNPNAVKTDITCFGINNGSITTNINGGIPFSSGPPYTISWTGPNGYTSSSPNINNLFPGLYTLSITDAGGCPIVNSYTVSEPIDILITTNVNSNVKCFGSANGAIAITASGGTGNYSYVWTKNGIFYAATDDISNLTPGIYAVTVSDANNCGPKTATFTITEPPVLAVSLVSNTNINCFGEATGAIAVNAVGGTVATGYNYLWSGPSGFSSSNQNLVNLVAGTYNLIVTDDSNCSKNLSVTLTQSPEIIITAVTTPIVCYGDNNATITVKLSGGNAPYQIQWSNLAVGLNQTNLAAGNYTITVTDNLGCQKVLTINIPSPPIFTVNPVVTNISCFGAKDGSIILNFLGGIAPVNLVWSDDSLAGITRNNLGPGTYSVVITDSKPCTISRTFTILEPQTLVLSANTTNALNCSDANSGAINLLVSGGTPPFTYLWNNGITTEDLSNIPAGNYAVTVKDSRNCIQSRQFSINRPPPIVPFVETKTDFNCATKSVKQSFVAQVSGGVPPYILNWSSGIVTGASNEIMNTNQNGTVFLEVTDNIGCKATYSFNVNIPTLGTPSFTTNSIGFSTYGFYSIEDPIQFTNKATGNFINIAWDFGDGSFSNQNDPIHTYKSEGSYTVKQTVTYPFGCVYVITLTLKLEKGYRLIPPTAFTPNNDGMNDYFAPKLLGLNDIYFDIYDTWGSLIYSESGDNIKGWDGRINNKSAENGNYYFKISAKTFYGKIVREQGALFLIN